jgi:hypothetical protein
MRRASSAVLALGLALAGSAVGPRAAAPAPILPVLVELFTSEGCEDCPPADKVLEQLIAAPPASGVEIVGLGEHVDYWDQLGWKDRFSSHALTARQGLYAARFANDSIYTPQMVVDGRSEFVGSDAAAARRAIAKAINQPHGVMKIDIGAEQARPLRVSLTITDLPKITRGDQADIIVAVTEDGLRTDVKRGENKGRVLTHAAVARYMATIGEAAADGPSSAHADIAIAPDWQRDRVKVIAFVQERKSRQILAAASAALKNVR